MALKIASIDGKQDVVVTSAEYVQATGIVGLETSGNIEKIIQGDKVILSGKGGGYQPISADEWNSCYETVSANSATWMTETDWTDDINAASAYALDEAKTWVENQNYITGVDLSSYYQKNETSGKEELSAEFDSVYNNIAKEYDPNRAYYRVGSLVMHDNQLYQAKDNTQSGEFDPIYWNATNIANTTVTRLTIYPDKGGKAYPPDEDVVNAIQSRSLIVLFEEVPGSTYDYGRPQTIYILTHGYISTDGRLSAQFVQHQFPDIYYSVSAGYTPAGDWQYMYGPETYEYSIDLKTNTSGVWTKGARTIYTTDKDDKCIVSLFGYSISAGAGGGGGGSVTGAYVPLSAEICTIGKENVVYDDIHYILMQGYNNTACGDRLLIQGKNNFAGDNSIAVGDTNKANYGLACGEYTNGDDNSIAVGRYTSAISNSVAVGSTSRAATNSLAIGQNVSASTYSLSVGYNNSAMQDSIVVGRSNSAGYSCLVQGYGNSAFGQYSVAIGQTNFIHKYNSIGGIAIGTNNSANGGNSIAIGYANKALNDYTFTVGNGNSATNSYAIGLGQNNSAHGEFAVTLSQGNTANGDNSFAVGYKNITDGNCSVVMGYQNTAKMSYSIAMGNSNNATGTNSVAIGYNCKASGSYAVAIGYEAHAGQNSIAIGYQSQAVGNISFAEGYKTVAKGEYSHAEGYTTTADGSRAHSEGYSTKANGYCSHAEGQQTTATGGNGAHAEGYLTQAKGSYSHAEGTSTIANSNAAHAEGQATRANGNCSHAEGQSTTAQGQWAHAEGYQTNAYDNYAHTEGHLCNAGVYGHAEGRETTAIGVLNGNYAAHAEGYLTQAQGGGTHAEGRSTLANNDCAHAEGYQTTATGKYSHSEGRSTTAQGEASHAAGRGTVALYDYETVVGYYNATAHDELPVSGKPIFVVGNGKEHTSGHDAFIVTMDGIASATNMYTSGGPVVTDVIITSAVNSTTSFVTNGVADLTPLYTYIKSLEDRIAALEAAQDGFTVNDIQPTVNGNTITVGE